MGYQEKEQDKIKENEKEKFTRLILVLCNAVLILGAVFASFAYAREFRKESRKLQMDAFCGTVESMKQLSESYIYTEKGYVDDWAAYIMQKHMTREEALEYIRSSNTQQDRYAHIVDMDNYAAWSTYIRKGNDSVNCYQVFHEKSNNAELAMLAKMRKIFEAEDDKVLVLGKYRVGESQQTVISVGTHVELREADGTDKRYLLLRIIPVDYLKSAWVFPTEYTTAEIGVITSGGEYVVQSASMKSKSFLECIRGYNFQDCYNDVEILAQQLATTESGMLRYKNYKGEDCYWYYSKFARDSDLEILGYIPAAQLDDVNMNWSLVFIVCGALLLLMMLDGIYILSINRKLKKTAAEAKRANRAKTEFLSTVSHDIRTPMNAVLGMTEIARQHMDDPERVSECLQKVSMAGSHLLTLINDILDISKVESGKMMLTQHTFVLSETLEETVNIIRPKAEEKQIHFEVHTFNLEKNSLVGDKLRLSQILINLLTNAVKYTEENGKILFEVCEMAIPEQKDTVRLICKVEDNGIGMTEEFQKEMYTSFQRATDSRIDIIQGSGLGLTITRQLVDLMGGTITCQSAPGEGTKFAVSLDFKVAAEEKEMSGEQKNLENQENVFAGMRVLIAEDNDLNWEIIQTMLEDQKIECDRAENGQKCVEILCQMEKPVYDLVLMDIQMPVLNGREATRQIRNCEKEYVREIPVVAMTADAFAEDIKACMEAGMDGHIAKPVDGKQVLYVLKQVRYGMRHQE